jgi:hypothetical protein
LALKSPPPANVKPAAVDMGERASAKEILSGFGQPALAANGTLAPEIALLDKPFNEPTLLSRIRQVLDVAR